MNEKSLSLGQYASIDYLHIKQLKREVISAPKGPFRRELKAKGSAASAMVYGFTLPKTPETDKKKMEDRIVIQPIGDYLLVAVVDAHVGTMVGDIVSFTFPKAVKQELHVQTMSNNLDTLKLFQAAYNQTITAVQTNQQRLKHIQQGGPIDGAVIGALLLNRHNGHTAYFVPSDVTIVQQDTSGTYAKVLPTKRIRKTEQQTIYSKLHGTLALNVTKPFGDEDFYPLATEIDTFDVSAAKLDSNRKVLVFSDGLMDTLGNHRMKYLYYLLDHPNEIRSYLTKISYGRSEISKNLLPPVDNLSEKNFQTLYTYLDKLSLILDINRYSNDPELFALYCIQEFVRTLSGEVRVKDNQRIIRKVTVPDDISLAIIHYNPPHQSNSIIKESSLPHQQSYQSVPALLRLNSERLHKIFGNADPEQYGFLLDNSSVGESSETSLEVITTPQDYEAALMIDRKVLEGRQPFEHRASHADKNRVRRMRSAEDGGLQALQNNPILTVLFTPTEEADIFDHRPNVILPPKERRLAILSGETRVMNSGPVEVFSKKENQKSEKKTLPGLNNIPCLIISTEKLAEVASKWTGLSISTEWLNNVITRQVTDARETFEYRTGTNSPKLPTPLTGIHSIDELLESNQTFQFPSHTT